MNHDASSHSMSMFRDWEAAVPFSGRLSPPFCANLDASLRIERAARFIRQKIWKFAASRSVED